MKSLRKVRPIGIALALIASIGIMTQQVRADGTTWTSRSATEQNSWTSITYGNEMFVAVAGNGTNQVMTSTDGTTWTAQTAPSGAWTGVTFGNGQFVAVAGSGTNRVMTSADGVTWTAQSSSQDSWSAVTFGNGMFVAVGGGPTNMVMTSTDGTTWTNQSIPATFAQWRSVTWGNDRFVAVSMTGGMTDRVMTSPDGTNWTYADAVHSGNWNSVTFGNGTFVAVASSIGSGSTRVMTSTDGTTWTARTEAATSGWTSVVYGNDKFIAVANSGTYRVMTSTDGITWTAHSASEASAWSSVTYGDGIYVAVASFGDGARVMTSGTFIAPTTTTPPVAVNTVVPGVTVTDTNVYRQPPAEVAAASAITVLTAKQNKRLDISSKTPDVCLPNDDELVFIDTGDCIAEVVNAKTRRVLRTLKTTVIDEDVSELNIGNEVVVLAPIYFDSGSTTVNRRGLSTLRGLKDQISAAGSVLVVGHSGTRNGNSSTNIALSRERASSTVAALRKIKAKGPFSVASVGALDPASKGTSEAAQRRNRRVVVVLIP